MQKDQLLELRSTIVATVQRIALEGGGSVTDRVQVLMGIVRSGDATQEIFAKIYELANSIEDEDEKLDIMLTLLYEVDIQLGDDESEEKSAPKSQLL